ncbi:unnamed protein product [Aphanomyces euteiches]|uniref:Uncharacterized protein n=1 Tax=Aphanomyces euteiches TaxID=100861 RepID=A0A6G0WPV2_9STRA|nr:hypothetical protein Ae201684_012913 [Aphanomyces euteiches]KAH9097518.1 hypothetical protein Ae201684P_000996 [Aphanomyces euteiches]KAH9153408.1 hypothetical protein AeRB84_004338 [Aphanomyces euteiches]
MEIHKSRLSSGSLDDLHTAAEAGLLLLEQNNSLRNQVLHLQEQVMTLQAQMARAASALELAASKYDSCWQQRCVAVQEAADVLKENRKLVADLKAANDRAIYWEREATKMENRLHHVENALQQHVQDVKQKRQSLRLSMTLPPPLPLCEEPESDNQKQTDEHLNRANAQIDALQVELAAMTSLKLNYKQVLQAKDALAMEMEQLREEQTEERELIQSMRDTISQLKQHINHLELTAAEPAIDAGGLDSPEMLAQLQKIGHALASFESNAPKPSPLEPLDVQRILDNMERLLACLKAHTPLAWARPVVRTSMTKSKTLSLPARCHEAIKCFQEAWPSASEVDFMNLTDWLHHALRGTGLDRPLSMRGVGEDDVAQVVATLVPLLQRASHRKISVAVVDHVKYTSDVILHCED